ncbi:isopentenyl transferase family protein [Brevibacillus sp. TJ4]|uniref:isopentenyl transferase family protein n=1 Tax=Brevibacillus sp. TJ4 TaxID=3234853 RepID=UPI0037D64720
METYALYGISGTGKSTIALKLAHQLGISAIIDDGILIYQGRKLAGASAKYEKTKIQAVKRAIFLDPNHAEEVRQALANLNTERLLILGTSLKMIGRIVQALHLPQPVELIPIESVKPPQDIEAARYVRETMGRHAIPIPRVEVEKDFLHRLLFSAQRIFSSKRDATGETTIVHPPFSGGRIFIHPQVMRKVVQATCERLGYVERILKSNASFDDLPRLELTLALALPMGTNLPRKVHALQEELYKEVGYCLNIAPASIDVQIGSIRFTDQT